MAQHFRAVKRFLAENDGDIEAAIAHPQLALDSLIDDYTSAVAAAVNNALQTNGIPAASVDAIGFHGQTCAHCPPSVSAADTYTLQVGNGQMLADLTGIPVIFDFRSDDLMNGGEGAPFAPHTISTWHTHCGSGAFFRSLSATAAIPETSLSYLHELKREKPESAVLTPDRSTTLSTISPAPNKIFPAIWTAAAADWENQLLPFARIV